MNLNIAYTNLLEITSKLKENGFRHFVMAGTLLGLIRNGALIPHDEDLDIGILSEDYNEKIIPTLSSIGFSLLRVLGTLEHGLELTFRKNNINIDIFVFYKENNYRWHGAYWKYNTPQYMIKVKYIFNDIIERKIGGDYFFVPENPENYLEQCYGADWRIPNSNWHWCASAHNIIQAPFDNKKDKTICLSMIVKNEAHIIAESLKAAKPFIDCWTIVDTGSTDNTKEIIKTILKDVPGELIERPWINFGHNRTEVFNLSKNKADFCLMLDADMILRGKELNKKILIADSYYLTISGNPSYRLPLLLSTKNNWKSIGATHEYWNCQEKIVQENLKTLAIEHLCVGDYRKEKFKNDIKLLSEGFKAEPNNSRYMFYLAQSYKDLKNYTEAVVWYQKRIEAGGWHEEIWYSMYMIALCYVKMNYPYQQIVEACLRAHNYYSKRAESLFLLLEYCREHQLYSVGYFIGKVIQNAELPNDLLFLEQEVYKYKIKDELSICAYYVGDYRLGLELTEKILKNNLCPNVERQRIEKNKNFCEEKLK